MRVQKMEGKVVIKTKLYKPKEIYMGERERQSMKEKDVQIEHEEEKGKY